MEKQKLEPIIYPPLSITDSKDVEVALTTIEEKNNISIIFCCESGSKAHGTAVPASDHDLKGIYLLKGKTKMQTYDELKIRDIGKYFGKYSTPFDYEFLEVNTFLDSLVSGNSIPLRWMPSCVVYRNKYPLLRETILRSCSPPHEECLKRMMKDLDKLDDGKGREAKKMVNMLIDCMFLVYMQLTEKFPVQYNIFSLLTDLSTISSEDFSSIRDLIQKLIYAKQKKSLVQLDQWAIDFTVKIAEKEKELQKTWKRKLLTQALKDEIMKSFK